jgi:hypothetical protein
MAEARDLRDAALRQRVELGMQQWERLAEVQIAQMHQRLDVTLGRLELGMFERQLDGLYQAMDAHLPPGLDPLPESYEGHVDDALDRQVADLQRQGETLRWGDQAPDRSRDQGMGL